MPELEKKTPVTSSGLSSFWLRATGRDRWVATEALVFSDEFASKENQNIGHHHVTYSFEVSGERYSGTFYDYGFEDEGFQRDDKIEIRYDPLNPAKSYYPYQRTNTRFHLLCFALGGLLGVIASAIQFFRAWHGQR